MMLGTHNKQLRLIFAGVPVTNILCSQRLFVANIVTYKLPLILCRCFLLTPKLLPDLQYSEACSILNVMNGPWIEQTSKGKFLTPETAFNLYFFTVDIAHRIFSL